MCKTPVASDDDILVPTQEMGPPQRDGGSGLVVVVVGISPGLLSLLQALSRRMEALEGKVGAVNGSGPQVAPVSLAVDEAITSGSMQQAALPLQVTPVASVLPPTKVNMLPRDQHSQQLQNYRQMPGQ